ncbi:helix-turn-helix domain-containing protein [Roseovarius sp. MMSF_3281]|uniref:helix-turn-helix domain-containing protein n=1 Tax=Roseovarius sp. MMSF_3281 TaxID=3046694 RepID=UPI00273F3BA6|nr:helix-turn-helix domain-containing protein [Roseovarius sp. MMSF_3281]
MIGRRFSRKPDDEEVEPRGFDDFELRLGDMMRGERATLGKSLLDVERELRIKASYIAAIENADPDAFDTPGFIPGYVRSYARYLNMDPDKSFAAFCAESGFSTAHGMSAEASGRRKSDSTSRLASQSKKPVDPLMSPSTPFVPASESFLARIEPGAIGSALVLLALIGGIGYGGWSVLNEVQRVQVAPVENTPDVLSDLDPLQTAVRETEDRDEDSTEIAGGFAAPDVEDRLDRLYRPEALDVPVMVARDAPISTLSPAQVGLLRPDLPQADRESIEVAVTEAQDRPSPQVLETPPAGVRMVAVRPAWVRVRAADGTVIYEGIMNAGDTWDVPPTEEPPTLRVGESGAIYFNVNGQHYGPAGPRGSVTSDLALDATDLSQTYDVADLTRDEDLSRYVAELQTGDVPQEATASE